MKKEERIEKMVESVLDDFDFACVHQTMLNLNLKWFQKYGKMEVPTIYSICSHAKKLVEEAASHYGEDFFSCCSGGFVATMEKTALSLQFVIEENTAFAEDFEDEE